MAYNLKAEGTNAFNMGEETVETIAYKNTSPNDSNARAREAFQTIVSSGRIRSASEGDVKDETINAARWSLVPSVRPDAYQKITAVAKAAGQTIRKYEFSQAFVVAYEEHFSNQAGVGSFKLTTRQKSDQQEFVKVSGGYAAE